MFLEEVPPDVLPPLVPGVCVVVGGGVGDDDGLPWGGAWMYHHRCRRCLRGYVDGVGGGCCYGVSLWTVRRRWWRPLGSAQVVVGSVIEWRRMGWSPGGFCPLGVCRCGPPVPVAGLETRPSRGGAVLWGELHCGDGVGEGFCAGFFLRDWW